MSQEQTQTSPWLELKRLVDNGDAPAAVAFIRALPPGETAHTIERLDDSQRVALLQLLPTDVAADLIESLADVQAADLIEELPFERAAAIVDQMVSDEQVDLISELDEDDAQAILERMDPQEAEDVRRLSRHDPDTAGGIMVTEYLAYPEAYTIDDVLADLRRNAQQYSSYDVQYVYIVADDDARLRGTVRLRDVVLSPGTARITNVMLTELHSIPVTAGLDELEDFFSRHDYYGAPVIDEQSRLLGVVRRAHVQEALAERADKAMLRIGGIIGGEELRSMPLGGRVARRLAFLMPNIGLNLIAVSVIAFYEPLLAQVSALMIFLPILSDMSGCAGNQAVAVSMRELALDIVKPFEAARVLAKEVVVGLVNGLVLGVSLGLIAWLMRGDTYPYLGLVVGSAMFLSCLLAVCIGGTVPLLLKAVRVDPALASSPLLTTITDLCGFFLALSFARVMLWATGTV
jgi:magnesium transporter